MKPMVSFALGLISAQREWAKILLDRREEISGLIHLNATLIVVPSHLTLQSQSETLRFSIHQPREVVVVKNPADLNKFGLENLKRARVIIASTAVFSFSGTYGERLARISGNRKLTRPNAENASAL